MSVYSAIRNLEDIIWKTPQSLLVLSAGILDNLLTDFDHLFLIYGDYRQLPNFVQYAARYSNKMKYLLRKTSGIPNSLSIPHMNILDLEGD